MDAIFRPTVSFSQAVIHPHEEDVFQIFGRAGNDPVLSDSDGNVIEQRLAQFLSPVARDIGLGQIGPDQPDSAIDIESHSTGTDDGRVVVREALVDKLLGVKFTLVPYSKDPAPQRLEHSGPRPELVPQDEGSAQ